MKVTIEIDAPYLKKLSGWASVSRTLNTAKYLASEHMDSESKVLADKARMNVEELNDIGPALDYLHKLVQTQIWEQQRKGK